MWIIKDWMNNHCYIDKKFESFEETRDFISEIADLEAYEKYPDNETKREELYNGICEDLYAEEVKKILDEKETK